MKLAVGTAQFGQAYGVANQSGQVAQEEVDRLLHFARNAGIDTLDSAIAYGDSEARIGMSGTRDFHIVTKLPPLPDGTENVRAWTFAQIEASRGRLKTDTLHAVLCHRAADWFGEKGKAVHPALAAARAEGLVERIGVSIYDPSILEPVMRQAQPDIVQAPMSVVDQRLIDSRWLARLHDAGVEVHARSVFLQGLLLMPRDRIPPRFERWAALWDRWQHRVGQAGTSPIAACLNHVLANPHVGRVVVGVDSLAHLRELVEAAGSAHALFDTTGLGPVDETLLNPSNWNAL